MNPGLPNSGDVPAENLNLEGVARLPVAEERTQNENENFDENHDDDDDMESIDAEMTESVNPPAIMAAAANIPPPRVVPYVRLHDPSAWRMVLTDTEIEWARGVRGAVVGDWNMDNLRDFHYAQLGLADGGNTDAAAARAMHWQNIRDEYKVKDTYEEGCQCLRELLSTFPGVFLAVFFSLHHDSYCLAYDISKFQLTMLTSQPKAFDVLIRGLFYVLQALCMDMESIRKGITLAIDCTDFDWDKHLNNDAERRIWEELMGVFPCRYRSIEYVNAGYQINVMTSLKKEYLSREVTDRIQTQRQVDGKLSDLYLVPTAEAATQHLLSELEKYLRKRYENALNFTVPYRPHES
jgi:hypothetical protein